MAKRLMDKRREPRWERHAQLGGVALLLAVSAVARPLSGQQLEPTPAAQNVIDMTLERMTELALSTSYEVQFLNLNIEETTQRLRAERARLRSSVHLDVAAPVWENVSEEFFNPDLGRTEFYRENELRFEGELSIRQPIILFGYPTNGYLSLNNRVYRVAQDDNEGGRDIEYYNRYFVRYTQPLFQPNELRNSLEEAELDLQSEEIDFYDDMLEIVDEAADDYFELFGTAYGMDLIASYVENLEEAVVAAQDVIAADPTRSIELDQIRVELANGQEEYRDLENDLRRQNANVRTVLNLAPTDSIAIEPVIDVQPIDIDVAEAVQYAQDLAPRLRRLQIQERERAINLDEVRGRNAFQVDLEFTYGREMRDPLFGNILQDPENTYTVDVNASIPIWDWGERDARIQASEVDLRRSALQIEQARVDIVSDVENEIRDVEELEARALTMEANLDLARSISQQTLEGYRSGNLGALDLLQTLRRELDTAENLVDAYIGWRRSIIQLQQLTYYDFEFGVTVMERYGLDAAAVPGLRSD